MRGLDDDEPDVDVADHRLIPDSMTKQLALKTPDLLELHFFYRHDRRPSRESHLRNPA